MNKTPTTLIIMDGFGLAPASDDNAVTLAKTPVLDRLFQEYAHTTLSASGLDVGLPAGQMGNSEVGHTNIGGGRVVFQDLPRISRAIEDGSFFRNEAYNKAMDDCLKNDSSLHLYGLLSDGGVHSHIEHLFALLQMARDKGLTKVYVHCFLDGRDVSPTSGKGFVQELQDKCAQLGVGRIATVMGRYYAMDRDKRWERVQMAYDAMVYGEGHRNSDPVAAVAESYANGVTDEFVEPVVIDPDGTISDNDSIIFFNYRPDRARGCGRPRRGNGAKGLGRHRAQRRQRSLHADVLRARRHGRGIRLGYRRGHHSDRRPVSVQLVAAPSQRQRSRYQRRRRAGGQRGNQPVRAFRRAHRGRESRRGHRRHGASGRARGRHLRSAQPLRPRRPLQCRQRRVRGHCRQPDGHARIVSGTFFL